jgi:DNA-binding transcriptional LysR family regulator
MIDLRNIETFYWAAVLGSLRATSEKLSTTQPAISQRIFALEASLSVRLFERDARGVTLTAKGHELFAHAERLLDARRDLIRAARDHSAMGGTLKLGVAETIVQTWLPKLIEKIHATYPQLVLEIEVDNTVTLSAHLASRRIDLAFLLGPILESRVENLPLCRYPLAWVAPPGLDLGPHPVSLERVAGMPIVTYPSTSQPYRQVRDMLMRAGIAAPRMYGCASLAMIARMVVDGIGAGVITPVFLQAEIQRGALCVLDVQADPLPALHFTASWLEGPSSHPARVIATMAQHIAEAHAEANGYK